MKGIIGDNAGGRASMFPPSFDKFDKKFIYSVANCF